MKKTRKLSVLALALLLAVSGLVGCGNSSSDKGSSTGSTSTGSSGEAQALDTSKEVELSMYFISNRPGKYDEIEDNFNKLFKEKLNCTLKTNWIAWSDYANKYPLLFSSGEEFDLAYTATWLNFYSLAQKGAFMQLDELWPTYAPNNWAKTSETAKTQATVNGHLYCIPTLLATYSGYGPYYRVDCLEGTDWDGKMENFADYEVYLDYIKENTSLTPYSTGSQGSELDDTWHLANEKYNIRGTQWLYVDLNEDHYTLRTWYQDPGVMEFLTTMKRWADKGFWSPSVLSDTEADKLKNGLDASTCHNIDSFTGVYIDAQRQGNGYEWHYANFNKDISPLPYTQDACVISTTSKNPERALALYDYITTDEEAFRAFYYGIEGTSYEIIDGQVQALNTDNYGFSSLWAARGEFTLDEVGYPQEAVDIKKGWDEEIAKKGNTGSAYLAGWTPDTTSVETEYAACTNVVQQYWWPLELGLTNDVEGSLAEFQEKMEAAGIDKVLEVFQKQLDEYCANTPEG